MPPTFGDEGQRVGCRACNVVFRDRATQPEPRPGAVSCVRPPGPSHPSPPPEHLAQRLCGGRGDYTVTTWLPYRITVMVYPNLMTISAGHTPQDTLSASNVSILLPLTSTCTRGRGNGGLTTSLPGGRARSPLIIRRRVSGPSLRRV